VLGATNVAGRARSAVFVGTKTWSWMFVESVSRLSNVARDVLEIILSVRGSNF
jgi:hypothetical protein